MTPCGALSKNHQPFLYPPWGKWMGVLIILSQFMMLLKVGAVIRPRISPYQAAFFPHIRYIHAADFNKQELMPYQIMANVNIKYILKIA